ncbi:hypothetical protein ACIRNU_33195 [Streptomyces rochei]|uniref:hypothetical protein n=1 Tax=Streptomyces rochei TaxID=1928 RepID=UPI0038268D8F
MGCQLRSRRPRLAALCRVPALVEPVTVGSEDRADRVEGTLLGRCAAERVPHPSDEQVLSRKKHFALVGEVVVEGALGQTGVSVIASEGLFSAADLLIAGDEDTVTAGLRRYFNAGATEIMVTHTDLFDARDRARTWAIARNL